MAAMSFNKQSFGGALMLDCDGWVAETPVANIFGVSGDVVFTPKIGSILPGITRESILGLAYYMGIPTQMGDFSLQDMKKASEVFITGTAAEVTPVSGIDAEVIGDGTMGPLTRKLSNVFDECARGKNAELAHWLTYV
jgi:branched-chain amino acid aminotransferase